MKLRNKESNNSEQKRGGIFLEAVRFILRRLGYAYFRIEVTGQENIPTHGGAIIASNHPSLLDGLLLQGISPRPVRFLVAEDFYNHIFMKMLFKAFECIPVFRTKTHNGDALGAAVSALKDGDLIGIYPEGTTYFRGSMQEMKSGVALLALKTGLPVIPMAIDGAYEAFPEEAKVPSAGLIRIRFDSPVTFEKVLLDQIPNEEVVRAREDIRSRILETIRSVSAQNISVEGRRSWIKKLRICLSGMIIWPLSSFLTVTSNPSLDPHRKEKAA